MSINSCLFGQNINLQKKLNEIDYQIDERDYDVARQLINKIEDNLINGIEDELALKLRVVKIQYFDNENDESINVLLDNLDKLNEIGATHLQYEYNSFIGQVFKSAKNFKKSIIYYKKTLDNAEKRKDTLDIIFSSLKLGSCFYRVKYIDSPEYYKNETDSALFYYKKALRFPENEKNNKLFSRIYDNLSRIETGVGNLDDAEQYANKAFKINTYINNTFGIAVSLSNLGTIYHLKGEYKKSIQSAEQSNIYIEDKSLSIKRDNLENIAKNYQELTDYQTAFKYLEDTYEISQILAKSILVKDVNKIEAKYNVAREQQNTLKEKNKRLRTQLLLYTSFFLIVILIILGLSLYARNRRYKRRFEKLMSKNHVNLELKALPIENENKKTTTLSLKKVKNILNGLDDFEKNLEFLNKDITMNDVAKMLNTNTNYLSKVVNSYKNKNFAMYINELRVYYAVNEIKNNKQFLYYTIDAIACEVGFNNAQSFSKAFQKITGLYPSYFIKQLQN